ncbi:MAG TPA: ATP-binding cassette domain-containing protein [Anaerolineae bacterium]|nr:ATP-binding cassette domain-containing protein [Anaerolineae bacterium]
MSENAVEVQDLTFQYMGASQPTLREINLTIRRGEIALLIGPTGAGKSTLYHCLNGLIPNLIRGRMGGRVRVAGLDTSEHTVPELAQKVGIVFQDPEIQIFSLSVRDELAFGPENLGLAKQEVLNRIQAAAHAIQLQDLLDREPARLSGGQQQSVAVGSVWSMLPEVVILDEPTSNLDPEGSVRVLELVKRLNQEYGKTILLAEHKIDEVAALADQVFVLDRGQIVLQGTPQQVFGEPAVLHELGLVAPAAAELTHRLKAYGIPLEGELPITIEDGVKLLRRLLTGGQPV